MTSLPLRLLRLLLPLCCLVVLVTGCAGTKLVNQWHDPSRTPQPYGKLLVVGVANDINLRKAFENIMAERLQEAGTHPVKLITYFPEDQLPNLELLKSVVKETGADGVLTTRAVKVSNDVTYVGGNYPLGYGDTGLYPGGDLYAFYGGITAMPTAQEVQTAILESRLFDVTSGTLVWAATTSSFNSDNQFRAIRDLTRLLTDTLKKEGYLPTRGTP